jgi:hypothetical protein
MPFPKAPALEYQIVLGNLGQRSLKSAAGRGRQNDVVEGSARRDAFDRAPATSAKKTRKWNRRHPLQTYRSCRLKSNIPYQGMTPASLK